MSRMMHNGDISYSSISAPNNYNGSANRGDCKYILIFQCNPIILTEHFFILSSLCPIMLSQSALCHNNVNFSGHLGNDHQLHFRTLPGRCL